MDLYVRDWDEKLQLQLRTEGLRRGLTVRQVLEEAVKLWLEQASNVGVRRKRAEARQG